MHHTKGSVSTVPRPHGLLAALVIAAVLAPLWTGCGGRAGTFGFQRDALRSQRIAEAYAPYRQPGSAILSGNISLTNDHGEKVVARNVVVRLIPATVFSRKVFAEATAERRMPLAELDELGVVIWSGRTNREGDFRFEGLPEGDYFVLCHVSWLGKIDDEPVEKTGLVAREVSLRHAQHRDIVLAPNYAEHAPR
jgi:hypothetical protein